MINTFLATLKAAGEWLAALGVQYPWLAPLSALVTIIGAGVPAMLWWRRMIVGKAYRIRREVEEKNERLEADIAALRSQVKLLKERLPEAAWQLAERERKDDNEESAIRGLRRHMETEGAWLSEMARQIARFHLGLITERDRDRHLVPAERFALLAFHLDPRHGEAGELLKEVQQLRGNPPFEHVQFTDDASIPQDDPDGYYGLPQTPEAVVLLIADAFTAIVRGHYRHAHSLAETAFLSARRWALGDREPLSLKARYCRAMAVQRLGHYDQALAEIDGTDQRSGILRLQEQSPDLGPTHPDTLSTRWLRADIVRDLGRHDQALAEIDGTDQRPGVLRLQEQSPDLGPTHPDTLSTRWLRAETLQDLGRHDQALAEIDGTDQEPGILRLREQSPDLGPTHPNTLITRGLRAKILRDLGRHDQALAEIDGTDQEPGILRLREQRPDLGPTHPDSLRIRWLRAEILQDVGRHDRALAEIDGTDQEPGILRLQEQSPDVGPTHPSTLATRSLRGAILCHLGHQVESERELRAVGADQEKALGPAHVSTLRSGHRLATTLVALGRFSEAEELLQAVITRRRETPGDENPDTQAAIADLEALQKRRPAS